MRPATSRDADVLAEVLERLDRIERLLQRPRRQSRSLDGAELLKAIHQSIGSVVFCGADLMARVGDRSLLAAFESRAIRNAKDLGVRLRGLCGRAIGDLTLERIGRDRGGTLWSVVKRV